jgi:hypothetical protein
MRLTSRTPEPCAKSNSTPVLDLVHAPQRALDRLALEVARARRRCAVPSSRWSRRAISTARASSSSVQVGLLRRFKPTLS